MVKILYFAWIKEKVGMDHEDVDLPDTVLTVLDLIHWLETRSDGFKDAFLEKVFIRAAIDDYHSDLDTAIKGAKEIAFFPPITGG
jgi:molybdopterin synthase sulfur carrier subunit